MRQIFGRRLIDRHPVHKTVNPIAICPVNLAECRFVAPDDFFN